jgi:hypothetical protein
MASLVITDAVDEATTLNRATGQTGEIESADWPSGKAPTTRVRRRTSRMRSSGLLVRIRRQCSSENLYFLLQVRFMLALAHRKLALAFQVRGSGD